MKSIADSPDTTEVAPSATVSALVTLWQQILGIPHIGVNDDFFELGGHSLLATRMIAKARAVLGRRLRMSDLFECPTIALLADRIETLPQARPR